MANSGSQRVVDGRMTKGALNAHGAECAFFVEPACYAQHRIQFQQRERGGRITQIDFALFQCCYQSRWKRIHVHFESQCQRPARTSPRAYASQFCTFNRLVELKRVTPKSFIAESGKAKCLPAGVK